MVTYREARILATDEAAYLAGLIDGEGTITLSRRHRTDNRQLVISISSCERPILNYVQQVRRCELILETYLSLTPRNGKYSAETSAARKKFEETLLGIKP